MTRRLASLLEVAEQFDAIVLDQWGVLHDGTVPYAGSIECLAQLKAAGCTLAVLSNSGKRAAANMKRIADMGFARSLFDVVMTSGEALWQDIRQGRVAERCFFPIERAPGDAEAWADGLDVALTDTVETAKAILLMGLPDNAIDASFASTFDAALSLGMPVLCTNPDRASPRADGRIVVSPGALAHAHATRGGDVRFYGKPHLPVFQSLEAALGVSAAQLLMVGDSLEHDVAGGHGAGWSTAFVEGGLHAMRFQDNDPTRVLAVLVADAAAPTPDFAIPRLK